MISYFVPITLLVLGGFALGLLVGRLAWGSKSADRALTPTGGAHEATDVVDQPVAEDQLDPVSKEELDLTEAAVTADLPAQDGELEPDIGEAEAASDTDHDDETPEPRDLAEDEADETLESDDGSEIAGAAIDEAEAEAGTPAGSNGSTQETPIWSMKEVTDPDESEVIDLRDPDQVATPDS